MANNYAQANKRMKLNDQTTSTKYTETPGRLFDIQGYFNHMYQRYGYVYSPYHMDNPMQAMFQKMNAAAIMHSLGTSNIAVPNPVWVPSQQQTSYPVIKQQQPCTASCCYPGQAQQEKGTFQPRTVLGAKPSAIWNPVNNPSTAQKKVSFRPVAVRPVLNAQTSIQSPQMTGELTFVRRSQFKQPTERKRPTKPFLYVCPVCKKAYSQASSMKNHWRAFHKQHTLSLDQCKMIPV